MRSHPLIPLVVALLFGGCGLEPTTLDGGLSCVPDASSAAARGDIDNPTSCQEVCNAIGKLCDDAARAPCYEQAGGALVQYESIEFVQSCTDRIAPTFAGTEGRLSLSLITCFCQ